MSEFMRRDGVVAVKGPDGRFVGSVAVDAFNAPVAASVAPIVDGEVVSPTGSDFVEAVRVADQFADCAGDLFFDSDNGAHDREVSLAEMADPEVAGNNCFAASTAVWQELDDDPPSGYRPLMIELATTNPESPVDSGVHWAVVLQAPDGAEMVLDFTARQFDAGLPWPLVAPVDEWRGLILSRIRGKHGGEFSSEFLVHGPGGRVERQWLPS